MDLKFIVAPLVGGVIGYVTNVIAIKMLFRPRKALYIGKWHIPFTPGLIPKEKERIAKSVGRMISTQLLNQQTLLNVLLSDKMLENIVSGIEVFIEKNQSNSNTLEETLLQYISKEQLDEFTENLSETISSEICKKINKHDFKEKISQGIFELAKSKFSHNSSLGFFSALIDDKLIKSISDFASEIIVSIIRNNSKSIIDDLVDSEIRTISGYKINNIINNNLDKKEQIISIVKNIYIKFIESSLCDILEKLNISKIIEEKICSFDVIEIENIILDLMKKELNAIEYLGAVLGFLMGFVNLLV